MEKKLYETPEVEVLELVSEGVLCSSFIFYDEEDL